MGGKRITMQADKVSVSDSAYSLQLGLKLTQIVPMLSVKSLNCNWSGIFQHTLVHCAGSTTSYDVFLTQVLSTAHDVFIGMESHIHVQNHKFWGT